MGEIAGQRGDSRRPEANRLIDETSPYLLQHAHNPVDWFPWGAEAFERARAEDRPILLSVGYAACHWCHVMEAESFENVETARLMNEHFVSVKVDREERPDVDALYMDAVQALTGSGGWPMTVFLTSDGAPFFAGTYFPPRDRYGMPGFPRVLRSVAEWWQTRREDVERQADEFRRFYRGQSARPLQVSEGVSASSEAISSTLLDEAAERLTGQMDAINGGFGGAPKFPHPMALDFLLRVEQRRTRGASDRASSRLMELVGRGLDKMAAGGIYDQLGGGFHRYSTDARWLVPHFEKMLYDNALLAPVYLHAWQLTGQTHYRQICEQTLDYVLREMTSEEGAFHSTQDADIEGQEGKFYVWNAEEISSLLSGDELRVAEAVWGVSPKGNFEGHTILSVTRTCAEVAQEIGISTDEAEQRLESARQTLLRARERRVRPAKDDKVLTSWNGLMLRAVAEAGRVLGRHDYREAAIRNATFLMERLVKDGRLLHAWRGGQAKIAGFLDDHAALVNGLLSTYEATGDARFLVEARRWADVLLDRFWVEESGSFFDTADDTEPLIGRPREFTDNATPSGTSLAVEALLRLAAFMGEERYRETATIVLRALAPAMAQQPSSFGHLLGALDNLIGPFYEVAIVRGEEVAQRDAMLKALASRFLPRMALARGGQVDAAAVPLLAGRDALDGKETAYVCQRFTCRRPVTTPDELLMLVED